MLNTTPLLDKIKFPSDLRKLPAEKLGELTQELRAETIDAVSKTGGHLGAGLGVIELTVAIHYVFNTPSDKLIWDVGHQSYPHKILTGRRDRIRTIRKQDGLSGFTKRSESEYDAFGAGHSSTSISAALGVLVGEKTNSNTTAKNVIAVIGDGAMSAGMAYEAMNNAGALNREFLKNNRLVVILNDNDMSIAPPVGAMSNYLARLASCKPYLKIRELSKKIAQKLPDPVGIFSRKFEKAAKEWWMGGNLFEELGFYYIGPVDGHNLEVLIEILQNIRDDSSLPPVLLHCVTQKGKGYNEVMSSADKLHAVTKFDVTTGVQEKASSKLKTYSQIFGLKLNELMKKDEKIIAITAAMPNGTGLDLVAKEFASRVFDVGIAEQHAVTFAAGLATTNAIPVVAIYSTFLQRAYDQIVHDVAVQQLPVRFCIDRAGFVGADGPTHAGMYDIAYLINLPNFVLMAPSNGAEFIKMLNTMLSINDRPSAIRYPRGETSDSEQLNFSDEETLTIGKAKVVLQGSRAVIISYGHLLPEALLAAERIETELRFKPSVIDARFAKPFDENLFKKYAQTHQVMLTIEEGATGGFGSAVAQFLLNERLINKDFAFRSLFSADEFIEQASVEVMRKQAGLNAESIYNVIKSQLNE